MILCIFNKIVFVTLLIFFTISKAMEENRNNGLGRPDEELLSFSTLFDQSYCQGYIVQYGEEGEKEETNVALENTLEGPPAKKIKITTKNQCKQTLSDKILSCCGLQITLLELTWIDKHKQNFINDCKKTRQHFKCHECDDGCYVWIKSLKRHWYEKHQKPSLQNLNLMQFNIEENSPNISILYEPYIFFSCCEKKISNLENLALHAEKFKIVSKCTSRLGNHLQCLQCSSKYSRLNPLLEHYAKKHLK